VKTAWPTTCVMQATRGAISEGSGMGGVETLISRHPIFWNDRPELWGRIDGFTYDDLIGRQIIIKE
jgi:hypothetical protein